MSVPKHVGIIMDGNRRFAKRLMLKPWKGHEWGAQKVKDVLTWCKEIGIQEITLYTFSLENFNRPKEEFNCIMDLFAKEFSSLYTPDNLAQLKNDGVRVNVIGRTWMLPEHVQKAVNQIMDATKTHDKLTVNFAMAYGGRAEIIDATKKISEAVKNGTLSIDQINEDVFKKNVYTESEPDLVIRTGGEHRTSGFMLWQSWYAELYFIDDYFPDLKKEQLIEAVTSFGNRERRFGK